MKICNYYRNDSKRYGEPIPLVGRSATKGCAHSFCFLRHTYAITAIISSTSIMKLLFARLASKLAACLASFLAAGRHGILVR
jgi:hypothetical protein